MENIDANLLLFYITFLAVLSVFLPVVLCVVMNIWHISFFLLCSIKKKSSKKNPPENIQQQMIYIMYGMLFLEENHTLLQGAALPTAQQYCPACNAHCHSDGVLCVSECGNVLCDPHIWSRLFLCCCFWSFLRDKGVTEALQVHPGWQWARTGGSFPRKLLATELSDQPRVSHTLLSSAQFN